MTTTVVTPPPAQPAKAITSREKPAPRKSIKQQSETALRVLNLVACRIARANHKARRQRRTLVKLDDVVKSAKVKFVKKGKRDKGKLKVTITQFTGGAERAIEAYEQGKFFDAMRIGWSVVETLNSRTVKHMLNDQLPGLAVKMRREGVPSKQINAVWSIADKAESKLREREKLLINLGHGKLSGNQRKKMTREASDLVRQAESIANQAVDQVYQELRTARETADRSKRVKELAGLGIIR